MANTPPKLEGTTKLQGPLQDLLQQYEDVFKEPKGLPPVGSHDHDIPLQEGV